MPDESLGGWSIERPVIDKIDELMEPGETILELGSGYGTAILSTSYEVISIEHDHEWVGKYDATYIHAPLVDGWYDPTIIQSKLQSEYNLILIDGPIGEDRKNIVDHVELFDLSVPLIFDDVGRQPDRTAATHLARVAGRDLTVYDGIDKQFGVV